MDVGEKVSLEIRKASTEYPCDHLVVTKGVQLALVIGLTEDDMIGLAVDLFIVLGPDHWLRRLDSLAQTCSAKG